MKKTWIRKDNKGVSPVIATILMVAITVVLAAVLYLMVSNFTDTGGGGSEPTITLGAVEQTAGNATIEIAGASHTNDLGKYSLILLANDVTVTDFDTVSTTPTGSITYLDINGDGKLGSGDKIKMSINDDTDYEIILYWKTSDAKITSASWST